MAGQQALDVVGLQTLVADFYAHTGIERRQCDLRRLEIVIAEDNRASRRVAEKAGARFEAVARRRLLLRGEPQDAAIYSFTADDVR